METTAYVALSRQMVLQRNMDIVANNIANMTSTGFKAEAMLLEPVIADAGDRQRLAFVQDVAVVRDLAPGSMTATDNPFDLAIEGPGYFTIETADGVRYGRGGQFRLNELGELATVAGDPVLDDGGGALLIPPEAGAPAISADGTISTADGVIGRIDVVTFADEQALRKVGEGLYRTDQAPQPATEARIVQGMLESSNVRPIVEMTEMMSIVRAYQGTQRLLEMHHELQRQSIERMLEVTG